MKAIITHYGYGQELAIGSVSKKVWDYIQDEYDGDVERYLDDAQSDYFGDHKIPDEFRVVDAMCALCDNDDLAHEYGGWLESGQIEITDDEGTVIYECDCSAETFERLGIRLDIECEVVDPSVRYISVFSSEEKGSFRTGEFDIEGEFDPTKLTVRCRSVEYDGEESEVLVLGFEYDGKEIDCDFGDTNGKSLDLDIIDTKADEDEEDDEDETVE